MNGALVIPTQSFSNPRQLGVGKGESTSVLPKLYRDIVTWASIHLAVGRLTAKSREPRDWML